MLDTVVHNTNRLNPFLSAIRLLSGGREGILEILQSAKLELARPPSPCTKGARAGLLPFGLLLSVCSLFGLFVFADYLSSLAV